MAAEVSFLMGLLTRHEKDNGGGGGEGSLGGNLVTRDLLGGYCGDGAAAPPVRDVKELDLGLGSTSSAWENRRGVADLNMPPLCSSGFTPPSWPAAAGPHLHNLLPEQPAASLDLRLRPLAPPPPPPAGYQSVCTLEKVRSALERAQRESPLRKPAAAPSSPASSSTTTSSAKRLREAARDEEGERESKSPSSSSSSSSVVVQGRHGRGAAAGMAAAGCPGCLLYVLISRSDPRCPRCNAAVPLPPPPGKRPRIDLNVATSSAGAEPAAAANPLRTVIFF